ncbi:hypothetical protein KZ483_12150 [Paenibacillus sp. sptzw28]|uniref:hypothetical protein n=1 Tax=Paenibacillus sp. sptzw28 TaxID=715179 RepID=UPI001C6E40B1|nr:hypothetical protein [Paenibacillus sp. sptzw28]QYR23576.1 hypothetical protein KZ483_12150 [Paenibacillus sp. sptzw28]
MSKIKLILAIVIGLIAINGCASIKENQFKLEAVITAIEDQGVKLTAFGVVGHTLNLNNVVPEMYGVETPGSTENGDLEYVNFYIFNTEQARVKGVKEFNKEMENARFTTFPFLYERGNALVIYWSKSRENPLFGKSIKTALEGLK